MSSLRDLIHRLRAQRGQTSAEYLGALLVVSAIIAALAFTDVGGQIADRSKELVCKIAGQECQAQPSEPQLSTCVLTSSERALDGAVKIFFFRLEGGVKGVREERADGSVRITLEANGGAGLDFSTPSADVDLGGEEEGTGERSLQIVGKGTVSRTWDFKGPDANHQADDFIDDVVDKVKAKLDWWPWTNGPDLPDETSTTISGGVEVRGKAQLSSGVGLEGNLGAAVGATYFSNGEKTVFFEVKGGLGAGASEGFWNGLGVSGKGSVRVGITYTKDGRMKTMAVYGTGDGTINGTAELTGGQLDDTLGKLSEKATDSAGGRLVLTAQLDLEHNSENRRLVQAFIDGRDPATGDPVSRMKAAEDLYDRFRDDGQVSLQAYALGQSSWGGGFNAGIVGGEIKYTATDATLLRAWYNDHERGLQPWDDCRRS